MTGLRQRSGSYSFGSMLCLQTKHSNRLRVTRALRAAAWPASAQQSLTVTDVSDILTLTIGYQDTYET